MPAHEGHREAVSLDLVAVTAAIEVVLRHHEGLLRMLAVELVAGVDRMHDGQEKSASGLEDSRRFSDRALHVVDVHQRHERDHEVGDPVVEGKLRSVGLDELELRALSPRSRDHRRRNVDPDDVVPALGEIPRQPAFAAADVEGQPPGRRDELQEGLSVITPVAVVIRLSSPPHPIERVLLPVVLKAHPAEVCRASRYAEAIAAEMPRRTKIVATIGPASSSRETLLAIAEAGMNAARLNFSHGTHEEHAERIRLVRDIEAEIGRPIAVIADLQGPKVRIGELPEPVTLAKWRRDRRRGTGRGRGDELPVSPTAVCEVLHAGHEILIDDGLVRLRVESVDRGRARCMVVAGGIVETHKGVNVPGVPVPIPSLTRKDMDDLDFALDLGVDFVALSFVRSAADVRDLRELITAAGAHTHVIAKIEKSEAVDALDAILVETDAVMVARGDLGVEIGAALVPLVQKRIILAVARARRSR